MYFFLFAFKESTRVVLSKFSRMFLFPKKSKSRESHVSWLMSW